MGDYDDEVDDDYPDENHEKKDADDDTISDEEEDLLEDDDELPEDNSNSSLVQKNSAKQSKVVYYDEDDFSEKEEEDNPDATVLEKLKKGLKKIAKSLNETVVDYGPPYSHAEMTVHLNDLCCHPVAKVWLLHDLLNARANPNVTDDEDLYYTPLHWCARNVHLVSLKMLLRAGANMNAMNEWGQTPLHLAIIMQYGPDSKKRRKQMKIAELLLMQGANANIRDKGGYCPIDYAAMNQDLGMIQLLIENGANVRRENYTLVAKRHHILRYVYDPDCYRMLLQKLEIEDAVYDKVSAMKLAAKMRATEAARVKKLHKYLERKRKKRQALVLQEKEALRLQKFEELKKDRLLKERAEEEELIKARKYKGGEWAKTEEGQWKWLDIKVSLHEHKKEIFFPACKSLLRKIKNRNKIAVYNDRWKELTDGEIEVKWTKSDPFNIPGLDSDDEEKIDELKVDDPLAFRDENDAELAGENLDDMLDLLGSV